MKRLSCIPALSALLGVCAHCLASDYGFFFTISNVVSVENPSTTVTLWAKFLPKWYAFGQSHTSVMGSPDPGWFADPTVLIYQDFACKPGEVAPDGDSVVGIHVVQYQQLGGQFADTRNPLELWSVTWTTDDFTPRDVAIRTDSIDFYVYINIAGDGKNFYQDDFAEAQGVIEVVPRCYGDFLSDGALDLFDFLAFVNAFNAGKLSADCTADGVFDLFDFLCFTNAFNGGC